MDLLIVKKTTTNNKISLFLFCPNSIKISLYKIYKLLEVFMNIIISPDGTAKINGHSVSTNKYSNNFSKLIPDLIESVTEHEINILFHGGHYTFLNGIHLNSSLSQRHTLTFSNIPGEKVVFSGAIRIHETQFSEISDPDILSRMSNNVQSPVYRVDLFSLGNNLSFSIPKQGFGWPSQPSHCEFIIDGQIQQLCRYPKNDFIKIEKGLENGFVPADHIPYPDGYCPICDKHKKSGKKSNCIGKDAFIFQSGPSWSCEDRTLSQMSQKLSLENHMWAFGYFKWGYAFDNLHIQNIHANDETVYLTASHPSFYGVQNGEKDAQRFYLYNALPFLSQKNEWYLDCDSKCLYTLQSPTPGRQYLLTVLKEPFFYGDSLKNITIKGINFENSCGHGIRFTHSDNIRILGCHFSMLGQKGIVLGDENQTEVENLNAINTGCSGGQNNQIISCDFEKIGQGGILIGGGFRKTLQQSGNLVKNCYFRDFSRIIRTYSPAIEAIGCGSMITNNTIHDAPHMAIRFAGNYHIIQNNEIYDVCYETSDVGVIYTLRDWTFHGNLIQNNYIHDITTIGGYGSAAIYLDDMVSGITVTRNLLVNIPGYALLMGGGRDNTFKYNIIINHGNGRGIHADNRAKGWAHACAKAPLGHSYAALMSIPYTNALWKKHFPSIASLYQEKDPYDNYMEAATPKNNTISDNILYGVASPLQNICQEVLSTGVVIRNAIFEQGTDLGFHGSGSPNLSLDDDSIIYKTCPDFQMVSVSDIGLYTDDFRHHKRTLSAPKFEVSVYENDNVTAQDIIVTPSDFKLHVNQTIEFNVTIKPDCKDQDYSAYVRDYEIADVAGNFLTGKRPGNTYLIVTSADRIVTKEFLISIL